MPTYTQVKTGVAFEDDKGQEWVVKKPFSMTAQQMAWMKTHEVYIQADFLRHLCEKGYIRQ